MYKQHTASFSVKGQFHVRHIRNGVVINSAKGNNVITDQGKRAILDCYFNGTSLSWAMGTTVQSAWAASAASTLASHGWTESTIFTTTRPSFNYTVSSNVATVDKTTYIYGVRFDCITSGSIDGALVVASATKLWSEFKFGVTLTLVPGDIVYIDYTVTMTTAAVSGVTGGIVTVGINSFMSVVFVSGSGGGGFTLGMVSGAHTFAVGDTMSSHAGWTDSGFTDGLNWEVAGLQSDNAIYTDITSQLGAQFNISSGFSWTGTYLRKGGTLFSTNAQTTTALVAGNTVFYDIKVAIT